jgi:methionyl-tRNA formyltransferase
MAGDESTGVSIMRLSAELDSGPVCAQAEEPIGPADTYGTVSERLMSRGADLLIAVLEQPRPFHDQDDAQATHADKLTPEDRRLDPRHSALELDRVVRALNPHVGAALALADGTRLGVWEAKVRVAAGPPPGEFSLEGPLPVLGCAEGALELVVVQPPGRRAMPGGDYLRGRRA